MAVWSTKSIEMLADTIVDNLDASIIEKTGSVKDKVIKSIEIFLSDKHSIIYTENHIKQMIERSELDYQRIKGVEKRFIGILQENTCDPLEDFIIKAFSTYEMLKQIEKGGL